MSQYPFTQADLEALKAWDTPTICNALELVVPARRTHGFTVRPVQCAYPNMKPICGLARVGTIRAAFPSGRTKDADRAARIGWYEYVAKAAMPTVVVLQDLDDVPGTGAFWGEVNSAVGNWPRRNRKTGSRKCWVPSFVVCKFPNLANRRSAAALPCLTPVEGNALFDPLTNRLDRFVNGCARVHCKFSVV